MSRMSIINYHSLPIILSVIRLIAAAVSRTRPEAFPAENNLRVSTNIRSIEIDVTAFYRKKYKTVVQKLH